MLCLILILHAVNDKENVGLVLATVSKRLMNLPFSMKIKMTTWQSEMWLHLMLFQ